MSRRIKPRKVRGRDIEEVREKDPDGRIVVHHRTVDTLGKMLEPERFRELRESRGMGHDGLVLPEAVADTYLYLHQQHRSAWTHELDLRSFSDRPWWNH